MSDFLTRLAQRQTGQIASVEARVPGLYAPIAAATPLPITEEALAEKSYAPRTASVTPRLITSPSTMDDSLGAALVDERQRQTMPKLNPVRLIATKSDEETLAGGNDATFNMEFPVLVAPNPSAQGQSGHLPLSVESAAARPASLSLWQGSRGSEESSERDARPRLMGAGALTPVVAPPRLERVMPARGEVGAAGGGQAAAEPPVHVTIGRIEVTAMTAPAAPRRASLPRKPAMSLDEYLARRQRREP